MYKNISWRLVGWLSEHLKCNITYGFQHGVPHTYIHSYIYLPLYNTKTCQGKKVTITTSAAYNWHSQFVAFAVNLDCLLAKRTCETQREEK